MKPKKYPYSGKMQKIPSPIFSARPIFNEVPNPGPGQRICAIKKPRHSLSRLNS